MSRSLPSKPCLVCGRTFEWRRKWSRVWDEVRYCSVACRRRGPSEADRRIEQQIVDLLAQRAAGATICPSEVARRLGANDWRSRMEEVRMAGRRLSNRGRIQVLQGGRIVDPSDARGPIRFRLDRSGCADPESE